MPVRGQLWNQSCFQQTSKSFNVDLTYLFLDSFPAPRKVLEIYGSHQKVFSWKNSWLYHVLAGYHWESYLSSVCLSFLTCITNFKRLYWGLIMSINMCEIFDKYLITPVAGKNEALYNLCIYNRIFLFVWTFNFTVLPSPSHNEFSQY